MNFSTLSFHQLLDVPQDGREQSWENEFLKQFPLQVVNLETHQPTSEYDGWPYMHVSSVSEGEPVARLLDWLSSRGIGLILNSQKPDPDYVFTYGMIWSKVFRGAFIGENVRAETSEQQLISGEPDRTVLPFPPRKIVKQFLMDQGIIAPKILLVGRSAKDFDLCFSIESFGNPPLKEHQNILEALSWFFPPDYSLVLARESDLRGFKLL